VTAAFWNEEPAVQQELEQVLGIIRSHISDASPYIRGSLLEMLASRGKLLRPAMVLISGRLGPDAGSEAVLRHAAVIEMLHIASLVHDDIIDASEMRRGIPTLHSRIGVRKAVIAGDYMLSRAMALLSGDGEGAARQDISHALCRLCDSEIAQDSEEWDFSISRTHYLRRIAGKTASLFALSGYAGAWSAHAEPDMQALMHRIGYLMGMTFQIKDDMLDITGSQADLGKPVGKDLREGIATLPVICALGLDRSGALHRRLSGRKRISGRDVNRILKIVREDGGLDQARRIAETYQERTISLIESIPDREICMLMMRMIERLNGRIS
jgi:heptaprenyl diphosphate synthase